MIRITDLTNVWENVISHLESLGYDRKLQILPDLYDYIDERCPGSLVVSDTALDESFDHGAEKGFAEGYDQGYDIGYQYGYDAGFDEVVCK